MTNSTFIIQFNNQSQVLLLKRTKDHKDYPNQWTLPGGKVDLGETPDVCAYRELLEETGIVMKAFEQAPLFLVGRESIISSYTNLEAFEEDTLPKVFPNREHVEYGWFDGDDLPEGISDLALQLLMYMAESKMDDLFGNI